MFFSSFFSLLLLGCLRFSHLHSFLSRSVSAPPQVFFFLVCDSCGALVRSILFLSDRVLCFSGPQVCFWSGSVDPECLLCDFGRRLCIRVRGRRAAVSVVGVVFWCVGFFDLTPLSGRRAATSGSLPLGPISFRFLASPLCSASLL